MGEYGWRSDRIKILFACVENACRSQMAEGFAGEYGDEEIEAFSGGSSPAERADPKAVEVMDEVGIDIGFQFPKRIDSAMTEESDAVVTMGCGSEACPVPISGRHIEWDIEDPSGGSRSKFREVRDEIGRRVIVLLEELGNLSTDK
ncbi:MAG: low molecular weight phosphatase family protein [Candidatus Hadarchaeota archaeon]